MYFHPLDFFDIKEKKIVWPQLANVQEIQKWVYFCCIKILGLST